MEGIEEGAREGEKRWGGEEGCFFFGIDSFFFSSTSSFLSLFLSLSLPFSLSSFLSIERSCRAVCAAYTHTQKLKTSMLLLLSVCINQQQSYCLFGCASLTLLSFLLSLFPETMIAAVLLALLACGSAPAFAAVRMPEIYGDNMVRPWMEGGWRWEGAAQRGGGAWVRVLARGAAPAVI